MARDIEEFLRKAAERRQQQQAGQAAPPANSPAKPAPNSNADANRPRSTKEQTPPPRRVEPTRRPAATEVIDVEVAESRLMSGQKLQSTVGKTIVDDSVSELVQKHLAASHVAEHARSLGSQFDNSLDKSSTNVHRKHDQSNAQQNQSPTSVSSTGGVSSASNQANDLLQMLSQPKTIRQAILISEILKRPAMDDDWN